MCDSGSGSESARAARGPLRCLRAIAGLVFALVLAAAQAQTLELIEAQRTVEDQSQTVQLPDQLAAPAGTRPPLRADYRLQFRLAKAEPAWSLYLPGLIAHARIRVNDHVLVDKLDPPERPLPRGLRRIHLIDLPQEFLRAGDNTLEIDAAGAPWLSVSPVSVGPRELLERRYERQLLGSVVGPAFVAVAIATLAVSMLLLWLRRREPLHGYFGIGALTWALHSAWSSLPVSPLSGVHHAVWWTSLYGFFVSMLVIFCVRFAGWHWVHFERSLWASALAAPVALYAANGLGWLGAAGEVWRMGLIAVVGVGLAAVARYAWHHRNVESLLLVAAGLVSFGFALRDWLVAHGGRDNNPIYLVPYAGLLFVAQVGWMLIDRFVAASRALERVNVELEQRVARKSSDLIQALEQMRAARDAAQAANRAKSTFIAAASHDLRQPIHAQGLYLAALRSEPLSPGQADIVQRMNGSLAAMGAMFNALLDISRIDAGAVVPQRLAFSVGPMLERMADEFAPLALEKGLRLSLRLAREAHDLPAQSDPILVERILRNLLANAVKFTHAGGVLLSARLRHDADGQPQWLVQVCDTGSGIPADQHERVFDEYYQIGNPERDRTGGLGLGLSIVQRLARLLGHPLTLHSQLGRGSRFGLLLPVVIGAPVPDEHDEAEGSIEGLGVAVVDDDPEVRESLQLLLSRWGCRPFTGADVAAVLRQAGPDPGAALAVIVADYRLAGGADGIEAIHAVRAACGRELPALVVSGESAPDRLAHIRASGFDAASKPLPTPRLRTWLARAARASSLPSGRDAGAPTPRDPP